MAGRTRAFPSRLARRVARAGELPDRGHDSTSHRVHHIPFHWLARPCVPIEHLDQRHSRRAGAWRISTRSRNCRARIRQPSTVRLRWLAGCETARTKTSSSHGDVIELPRGDPCSARRHGKIFHTVHGAADRQMMKKPVRRAPGAGRPGAEDGGRPAPVVSVWLHWDRDPA